MIHPNYYRWWQAFRRASNEDEILATWVPQCVNKVLANSSVNSAWTLLDVGAFDGSQALNIVRQVKDPPTQVKLVEPSAGIQEAKQLFQQAGVGIDPIIFSSAAEECVDKLGGENQLSILVHSAYYISTPALDQILEVSDRGALVFLDTLFSVFAKVGKALNLELWERLHHANVWVKARGTCVSRKNVKISLRDPAQLEYIYSFIALREFNELAPKQQKIFQDTISASLDADGYLTAETECWYCTK